MKLNDYCVNDGKANHTRARPGMIESLRTTQLTTTTPIVCFTPMFSSIFLSSIFLEFKKTFEAKVDDDMTTVVQLHHRIVIN